MKSIDIDNENCTNSIFYDYNSDGIIELFLLLKDKGLTVINTSSNKSLFNISFVGECKYPPLFYYSDNNLISDLIIYCKIPEGSVIYSIINGQSIQTINIPHRIETECRIFDIDLDQRVELIVPTIEGFLYSIDLPLFKIDWCIEIHKGLFEPVAIFIYNGIPRIALTTGKMYEKWKPIGSSSLYIINGMEHSIEWVYNTQGEMLSTAPSIFFDNNGNIFIAFCNLTGSVFIIDYINRAVYYERKYFDFSRTPFWTNICIVTQDSIEDIILIFQGQRCIFCLDFNNKQILWTEYYNGDFDNISRSYCSDINNDMKIELILLEKNLAQTNSTIFVKELLTGKKIITASNLLSNPKTFSIEDADNDGNLELILTYRNCIQYLDCKEYILFEKIKIDNSDIGNNLILLYPMYKQYRLSTFFSSSVSYNFIKYIKIYIDPDNLNSEILLDIETNTSIYPIEQYLIIYYLETTSIDESIEVTLSFTPNWSFPHEESFRCAIEILLRNGYSEKIETTAQFQVEKGVTFDGILKLYQNGSLRDPNDWFVENKNVSFKGLSIIYDNSSRIYINISSFEIAYEIAGLVFPIEFIASNSISFEYNPINLKTGIYTIRIFFRQFPSGALPGNYTSYLHIDAEPPRIIDVFPEDTLLFASSKLLVGIIGTDYNGSGIDSSSVMMRIDFTDDFDKSSNWIRYMETLSSEPDFIVFFLYYPFISGSYSFQWRVQDEAGHLYVYSKIHKVSIELVQIVFHDWYPTDWQNSTLIHTGVNVRFNSFNILNSSRIQFSYGPIFSSIENWTDYQDIIPYEKDINVSIIINCSEGKSIFIRWRIITNDTIMTYSSYFQLRIDTKPPYLGKIFPSIDSVFDDNTITIDIPLYDDISGIDKESIVYRFFNNITDEVENWVRPSITDKNGTNHVFITFMNLTGKNNFFVIRLHDNAYNEFISRTPFQIKINEAPIIKKILPKNGTQFEIEQTIRFEIDCYDPDISDILSIKWVSSRGDIIGNGLNGTLFLYYEGRINITVYVLDNHGHNVTGQSYIIVQPRDNPENQYSIFPIFTIIIIIIVAISIITISFIFRNRRRSRSLLGK